MSDKVSVSQLKVSSKSVANKVAGAIVANLKSFDSLEVQGVGAGAINQIVKSIAIARGFMTQGGFDIWCQPNFVTVNLEDGEKTGVNFCVKKVKSKE